MKKNNTIVTVSIVLITIVAIVYVLYVGAPIIIPFVIALLFSFALTSLSHYFASKWVFQPLAFLLSLGVYLLIIWIVTWIINSNIQELIKQAPIYQEKLIQMTYDIADYFSVDQSVLVQEITSRINIPWLISDIATGVTNIVRSTGAIIFFTVFILLEWRHLRKKISLMTDSQQVFNIISMISRDMKMYFGIKTLTSLATSILSYIIMIAFGLDFALFWAFLIFILNYIPTVGSIIAVFFPVIFSFIQFESLSMSVLLFICLTLVQMLIGNIIEPRLMGTKLNLSPLVILLSLLFWWKIWWVAGMLLCVPIMVIINIILAHIPETRGIAVLMSERGNIEFGEPQEEDSLSKGKTILKKMKKKLLKKKKAKA